MNAHKGELCCTYSYVLHDASYSGDRETALHVAARRGKEEAVQLLIVMGADTTLKGRCVLRRDNNRIKKGADDSLSQLLLLRAPLFLLRNRLRLCPTEGEAQLSQDASGAGSH